MVYLKTKNNKKGNLDSYTRDSYTGSGDNRLLNIRDISEKIMVLSLILLLGNPKIWSYLDDAKIITKPIHHKLVASVLIFIVMTLYYTIKPSNSRKQIDIIFTCIVVVYLIYIWKNKESFIIMDSLDEEDMDLITTSKGVNSGYKQEKVLNMHPIEEVKETHELVDGLNKPEHYDYTPDDIPTYQMSDELKVFKQMSDMKKKDINAEWMNKVEGHDPKVIPAMEGGFPFYDNKEKVHDLFDKKHHQKQWNDSILTALQECPRTPSHLLDKSGGGLPDISHYHRENGSGQSKYKFLNEKEPKLGEQKKLESCSITEEDTDLMNEYAYASDEVNFKIGGNSMNISQGCSNFPIPGYTNLKKINDNTAYSIETED